MQLRLHDARAVIVDDDIAQTLAQHVTVLSVVAHVGEDDVTLLFLRGMLDCTDLSRVKAYL